MKNDKIKQFKNAIETAQFIASSSLPLSEEAKESISESGNITFGDANRTMITLARYKDEMNGTKADEKVMDKLIEEFGENFYVDLEN